MAPPTRAQAAEGLAEYLKAIDGDLQLATVLAFDAHKAPAATPLAASHAAEIVLWVEDESANEDIRKRYSIASVELEPLEVVAQSFGGGSGDMAGFRRMLLTKGQQRMPPVEGGETYTVVIFALPRPPAPPAVPDPKDHFSLIRVLNYNLPAPYPVPEELKTTELEDWRHLFARGCLEPWKAGTKFEVVAQMAVLRSMERQALTPLERTKRDQEGFKHLTRHLLHVAAPQQ